MPDEELQNPAERLLTRLDALAAALVASGASDEAAARVLASASTAVLQALALDELRATAADPPATPAPRPTAGPPAPAEPDVPLAA